MSRYLSWLTLRRGRRRVLISCGRLSGRRGSGHLDGHLGSGPFGLDRLDVCRGPCRRSDLGSGPCFCPCFYLCRRAGDLCGLVRRNGPCGVCCVCRRSHSRGYRAGGHLGEGAHRTNHSGRALESAGHAACCFVAVVWPGVRRSLTQTRKRSRIFFCVGVDDSLSCGEHYIMANRV